MSVQGFRPENELEAAMQAASRDERRAADFYRSLYGSDLYVPSPQAAPPRDRWAKAGEGEEIELPVVTDRDGRSYVPVFTSMTQLLKYVPEGAGYMRMKGQALVTIWPQDCWMALNPKGDLGVALPPEQVRALPHSASPTGPPPPDAGLLLGEPKEEPAELLNTIRLFAERNPEIQAAYRALLLIEAPGQRPQIVIGLRLDQGADEQRLIQGAKEAARESGVASLGLVPVRGDDRDGVTARFMLERTRPFYVRAS